MKAVSALLFLIFSITGFAQDFKPEHLVGRWRIVAGSTTCDEVIRPDGTSSAVVTVNGKIVWKSESKWWLEGNKRHYQYTASSIAKIPVGKKGVDTLIQAGKEHFLIETSKGTRERYVRVAEE